MHISLNYFVFLIKQLANSEKPAANPTHSFPFSCDDQLAQVIHTCNIYIHISTVPVTIKDDDALVGSFNVLLPG